MCVITDTIHVLIFSNGLEHQHIQKDVAPASQGTEYEEDKPIGPSTEGLATPRGSQDKRKNVEILFTVVFIARFSLNLGGSVQDNHENNNPETKYSMTLQRNGAIKKWCDHRTTWDSCAGKQCQCGRIDACFKQFYSLKRQFVQESNSKITCIALEFLELLFMFVCFAMVMKEICFETSDCLKQQRKTTTITRLLLPDFKRPI